MLDKHYRSINSKVEPSEELINQTKAKMYSKLEHKSKIASTGLYRYSLALVSLAIVIVAITVIPNLKLASPIAKKPTIKAGNEYVFTNKILTTLSAGQHVKTVDLANGKLVFSENDFNTIQNGINLHVKDAVIWKPSQVIIYLGKDVRPKYIPATLKPLYDYSKYNHRVFIRDFSKYDHRIFVRENSIVYYDNIGYAYKADLKDKSSPHLSVVVSKGKHPAADRIYVGGKDAQELSKDISTIGVTKISVQHYKKGYFAEFIYGNNGYFVMSDGISQEEFIKVLISIVQ